MGLRPIHRARFAGFRRIEEASIMLPGYRPHDPIAVGPRSIVTRAIRETDSTLVVIKSARRPEDAERLRQEFAIKRG
jgi:hypothetical protein